MAVPWREPVQGTVLHRDVQMLMRVLLDILYSLQYTEETCTSCTGSCTQSCTPKCTSTSCTAGTSVRKATTSAHNSTATSTPHTDFNTCTSADRNPTYQDQEEQEECTSDMLPDGTANSIPGCTNRTASMSLPDIILCTRSARNRAHVPCSTAYGTNVPQGCSNSTLKSTTCAPLGSNTKECSSRDCNVPSQDCTSTNEDCSSPSEDCTVNVQSEVNRRSFNFQSIPVNSQQQQQRLRRHQKVRETENLQRQRQKQRRETVTIGMETVPSANPLLNQQQQYCRRQHLIRRQSRARIHPNSSLPDIVPITKTSVDSSVSVLGTRRNGERLVSDLGTSGTPPDGVRNPRFRLNVFQEEPVACRFRSIGAQLRSIAGELERSRVQPPEPGAGGLEQRTGGLLHLLLRQAVAPNPEQEPRNLDRRLVERVVGEMFSARPVLASLGVCLLLHAFFSK